MSLLLQALKRADAQKRQPADVALPAASSLALVTDGQDAPGDEALADTSTPVRAEPVLESVQAHDETPNEERMRENAAEPAPLSPSPLLARQLFVAKGRPPRRWWTAGLGIGLLAVAVAAWWLEPWRLEPSTPAAAPTTVAAEKTVVPAVVPEPAIPPERVAPQPAPPESATPVPQSRPDVRERLAPSGPDEASTRVEVHRGEAGERIPAAIESGYDAFQAGQWREAEAQYRLAVRQDARSRDALLGLAAALAQQGKTVAAIDVYQQLVRLYPEDSSVQAGLAALQRDGGERQRALLKQQADVGDADAAFVLGNRLAAEGRWPEAQAAYFQAYTQVPVSADYAYNLAVSLDHLQQPAPAADYYRRALKLAGDQPARFDAQAARSRLAALTVQP
ncbi:tetratricopeptide repeat protein [Jeongeupia naejangsanensis]|uniref:Tetratricopeptide repeat protein n=1 Tax=Jeongeupia naejangsanensis TaxID=613195 RepID=A0ABS2BK14_9NEIS|nr:tetratricopeptide repeat protein [Jeongeupia naejangsanensis]MBM3115953.1 tetratricopeptide repeat protein [Jeongeupia naejangsanensis]